MQIKCPQCRKSYKIPDEKIPDKGAYVRCSACKNRFMVQKPILDEEIVLSMARDDDSEDLPPSDSDSAASSRKVTATPDAVDQSTKVTCPHCGFHQPPTDECVKCGVIISKFNRLITCPHCGHQQPKSNRCTNCGEDLSMVFQSTNGSDAGEPIPDKETFGLNTEAITSYAADKAKSTFMTTAIIAVIIIVIFLATGRFIFFALFQEDRELMYQAVYDHCRCTARGNPCPGGESVLLKIKIGNTGEEPLDNVRVTIDKIPYNVYQIYFSIQNLSAGSQRAFDPSVVMVCTEEEMLPIHRFPPSRHIFEECAAVSSYAVDYLLGVGALGGTDYPDGVPASQYKGFESAPPCPVALDQAIVLQLNDFAAGALVQIGIMSYFGAIKPDIGVYQQVKIDITAENAEVRQEDPQLSALVRFYKSIVDTIF